MFNIFNVRSDIRRKDLDKSIYFKIYDKFRKRKYKDELEIISLIKINVLIKNLFPKRIRLHIKKQIIDCVVLFLKYINIRYKNLPEDYEFKVDFHKIITMNLENIRNKYFIVDID
jgi:hypothetical protein